MILNDEKIDEYINIVDDKVIEIKKKWEENNSIFNVRSYVAINKLFELLNMNVAYVSILNSINNNVIKKYYKNKKTINYLNIIELSLLPINKLKNLNYKKPYIDINGNRLYNSRGYYYNRFKLETEDKYSYYNANISIKNERNYSQYLFNIPIYGDKVTDDSNFIDLY